MRIGYPKNTAIDTTPSQGSTTIQNARLAHLLLCAFRYSLWRRTYIVSQCCDWLREYWPIMPEPWKRQICEDIEIALRTKSAGMAIDEKNWKKLLEFAKQGEL